MARDMMPNFELLQPAKLADALSLLDRRGKDIWKMAGGNDMSCTESRNGSVSVRMECEEVSTGENRFCCADDVAKAKAVAPSSPGTTFAKTNMMSFVGSLGCIS